MFSKTAKKNNSLDPRQKELFEHAQERIKEKKGLYTHFIFYIVGCIFALVINLLLGFGENFTPFGLNWFVYFILIWSFILLIHLFRVLFFAKFMGKEWQAKQMEYLVEKQNRKIAEMDKKLSLKIPKEAPNTKTILMDKTKDSLTTDNEI